MKVCPACGACSDDEYDLCAFDGGLLDSSFVGPRVIDGRYLLEQRIAAGAMGTVYRAIHLQVGSQVAVKVMRPEDGELQVALARFHREAQILGQIKHPHAVLVMDFGVEERPEDNVPYLVTEYLRGEPLSAFITRRGPLPLHEAANIITQVCEAVAEAHSVGVIHRDLKPSNIFVEQLRDGTQIVKVLDFGIAKFVERTPDVLQNLPEQAKAAGAPAPVEFFEEVIDVRSAATVSRRQPGAAGADDTLENKISADRTLTEAGFMIGTIRYMAPEQMTGERVSRATDGYAIASVLFQLLTGHAPFLGGDDEVINAKVSDERPLFADYGLAFAPAFETFLSSCFALEPEDRPPDVMAIAEALTLALDPTDAVSDGDLPGALAQLIVRMSGHLADMKSVLSDAPINARSSHYATVRDAVLSLSGPADEALILGERAERTDLALTPAVGAREDAPLSLATMRTNFSAATLAMRQLDHDELDEQGEYLSAVWQTVSGRLNEVIALLERQLPGDEARRVHVQNPFAMASVDDEFTRWVSLLDSDDVLESAEALERIVDDHLDTVATLVARSASRVDAQTANLISGLARHADVLLLMELYPQDRRFRLLPLLSGLAHIPEAAPFVALEQIFTGRRHGEQTALEAIHVALGNDAPPWAVRAVQRCLLVHPLDDVRHHAAGEIALSDFWNVIVYPRTPIRTLRTVFDVVLEKGAPNEYLKIFFLCIRPNLSAPDSLEELEEAFLLMGKLFALPCFAEDIVFEPLLASNRALMQKTEAFALSEATLQAYREQVADFSAHGATESVALEHVRDIALPVQRKLAREGLFLTFFATHRHERIAKETIVHLLRMDDIIRFLRLPTLHRAVLVELAKKKRFFRKDAGRVALLSHPKTPVHIARLYIALLPHEQIRLLSKNKHISADVRILATTVYQRLQDKRGRA